MTDAPDALVGDALPRAYAQRPSVRACELIPVGASAYELPAYRSGRPGDVSLVVVGRRCPDPNEARAFAVWLRDGQRAQAERNHRGAGEAAGVALSAAEVYLRGSIDGPGRLSLAHGGG